MRSAYRNRAAYFIVDSRDLNGWSSRQVSLPAVTYTNRSPAHHARLHAHYAEIAAQRRHLVAFPERIYRHRRREKLVVVTCRDYCIYTPVEKESIGLLQSPLLRPLRLLYANLCLVYIYILYIYIYMPKDEGYSGVSFCEALNLKRCLSPRSLLAISRPDSRGNHDNR